MYVFAKGRWALCEVSNIWGFLGLIFICGTLVGSFFMYAFWFGFKYALVCVCVCLSMCVCVCVSASWTSCSLCLQTSVFIGKLLRLGLKWSRQLKVITYCAYAACAGFKLLKLAIAAVSYNILMRLLLCIFFVGLFFSTYADSVQPVPGTARLFQRIPQIRQKKKIEAIFETLCPAQLPRCHPYQSKCYYFWLKFWNTSCQPPPVMPLSPLPLPISSLGNASFFRLILKDLLCFCGF